MANEIKLSITVDDKGAVQVLQKVTGEIEKTSSASQKQSLSLKDLQKNWVALTAGAAALYAAVVPQIEAYMASEKASMKLGLAMKNQGTYTKAAFEDMVRFSEQMQKTTTVEDDLAKSIMGTMYSFGMSTEEVKKATMTAANVAAFTGNSIAGVTEQIGKAFMGNVKALKEYGIEVDSTGSKSEKFTSVMEQLNQKFGGSAQAELLTYAGQWQSLKNQWGDIQEMLGLGFLKVIHALGFAFYGLSLTINGVIAGILQGLEWVSGALGKFARAVGMKEMADSIDGVTKSLGKLAEHQIEQTENAEKMAKVHLAAMTVTDKVTKALDKMGAAGKRTITVDEEAVNAAKKAASAREAGNKAITESIRKSAVEIAGIHKTEYEKAIGLIEAEAKKYKAAGYDKILITRYVEQETYKAKEKESDRWLKSYLEDVTKIEKAEQEKSETLGQLAMIDAKSAEKYSKDKADAYRTMYGDMKGDTANYYTYQLSALDAERKNYEKLTGDKVVTDKWYLQQKKRLDQDLALSSNNFFQGVNVGIDRMLDDHMTFAKAGLAVYQTFAKEAKSSLSNMLFDGIKGDLKSFSDYWDSFFDSLLRTFTDTIAEMAVQQASKAAVSGLASLGGYAANAAIGYLGESGAGKSALDWLGGDWDWLSTLHAGAFFVGQDESPGDRLKQDEFLRILQRGEMVLPKDLAEQVRGGDFSGLGGFAAGMGDGGTTAGNVAAGQGFMGSLGNLGQMGAAKGLAGIVSGLSPSQAAAMAGKGVLGGIVGLGFDAVVGAALSEAGLSPSKTGATLGALGGGVLGGIPGAILGSLIGNVLGALATAADEALGVTLGGRMAAGYKAGMAAFSGMSDQDLNDTMGDLGSSGVSSIGMSHGEGEDGEGRGGESYGGGDGDTGGMGHGEGADGEGRGGERYGGLVTGPESGYTARLHGTELVVSQKRDMPVTVRGGDGNGRGIVINSPLIHIEGNLIADKRTFDDFAERIFDRISKLEAWGH